MRIHTRKGFEVNNPDISSGLQKLLAMLENKTTDGSSEQEKPTPKEPAPTPASGQGHRMVNPEVSSRLKKLLAMLETKTVHGSIEWKKPTSDDLFSTSVARSSFTIATSGGDVDAFTFGMYDSRGILVSLVTSTDEQYPEDVKDNIRKLWTTVSTRASHLVRFLDQALNALENEPPVSRQ
jgi:hypothetical protein